jgi:AcrR family transcriptional regulator
LSSQAERPAPGLRERKKAKTRAAIQRHALRLFREQGYDATTVEQIAGAAEISPSTFFRYFPTKEDVVLYDAFDPLLFATFAAQPAELSPIQAIRRSVHTVFGKLTAEELREQWERAVLVLSVPELRMRMLDATVTVSQQLAALVAERVGRRADEIAVQALVGAVLGALIAVVATDAVRSMEDYLARMDASLACLEAGLPL